MESEQKDLATLFPNVAAQLRGALSNLRLAAAQLVSPAEREKDPQLDQRAALLDQSYYQMLRLVNDLSMAEYLTHEEPLPLLDRDVVALVRELCEQAASVSPLLGLEVRFSCAQARHLCGVNPRGLEQIVTHLLSNALKFTPAGGVITVEMQIRPERVLLAVADTGCGIPEKQMETLFERYLHADPLAPQPHGLGLGLPLCRRLAEGQGGSLMAESRVGKGSRFVLSLPNKLCGTGVSDVAVEYSGGFNKTLLALADALPAKAFLLRSQE